VRLVVGKLKAASLSTSSPKRSEIGACAISSLVSISVGFVSSTVLKVGSSVSISARINDGAGVGSGMVVSAGSRVGKSVVEPVDGLAEEESGIWVEEVGDLVTILIS